MRLTASLLLLLLFFSCSNDKKPPESEVSSDSADVAENPVDVVTFDSLDNIFNRVEDSLKAGQADRKQQYLSIITSFSGYENSANSTWYFDKEFNMRYCEVSWDMEGTSGKYAYYFQNSRILWGTEENQYNDYMEFVKVFSGTAPTYGYAKTEGSDADGSVTYLTESDFDSKDNDVKMEFDKLLSRIRENAEAAVLGEEDVTIHIEDVENYSGTEVTETEDYTISRKLFEYLTRD